MNNNINNKSLSLNRPQWEAFNSDCVETFLIGGIGMGKSFFLAIALYRALSQKDVVCGLFAPTNNTLRDSTLKQVQEAWASIGFEQDVHYVINVRPPEVWGVKPFSSISNNKIITTSWGSYCVCDGLDNFNTKRGSEFDEIFVDEFRDVKDEARLVLLGRLRGSRYKSSGKKHRLWYATTPPDNPTYLNDLYRSSITDFSFTGKLKFIFGTSNDNKRNLPTDYVETLKNTLDEITFRREVMGELISYAGKRFLWTFSYEKHVSVLEPDFTEPVYLSFDFNIDPLTCIAVQNHDGKIWVLKEFTQRNSDIWKFCSEIKKYIVNFRDVYVTGDPAGKGRTALAAANTNYYTEIIRELNIKYGRTKIANVAAEHGNSHQLCNSIVQNHPGFKIDHKCYELINDIEVVVVGDDGKIDKSDTRQTHWLDCLRYYLHMFHYNFIKKNRNEYR